MTKPNTVTFLWGDGEHSFRLGMKELLQIQSRTKGGPFSLYTRLRNGDWLVEDLVETHRWALVGGGMVPTEASALVKTFVEERPLLESVESARLIMMVALSGPPDSKPQKKTPPKKRSKTKAV